MYSMRKCFWVTGVVAISMGLLLSVPFSMAMGQLVGYWSFDKGDVSDLSGTGNDGVIQGDPTVVEGMVGDALELDGIDDWVDIPDNPTISEFNEFSLSAWIKPIKLGPWVAVIEKAIDKDWSYGFFIEPDSTLSFEFAEQGKRLVCCIGDFKVEVDTWYHVACVFDGKMGRLYVDGNLEGEMPGSGPIFVTAHPLAIGTRHNHRNRFGGVIDEVTLWNKAVTVEEMQNVHVNIQAVEPPDKLSITWASIRTKG